VPPVLTESVRKRLDALGVAVVTLTSEAGAVSATIDGTSRWIERLIADSAAFSYRLQQVWGDLTEATGDAVPVWPGVWLAPLSSQRRRRLTDAPRIDRIAAALLVGAPWLESEQLHHICDAREVDFTAAVSKVDRATLISAGEAQRLAAMLAWMNQDATELGRRDGELAGLSNELSESYEELSLLYKLATNMTVDQPPATFLKEACRELHQVVGLRWLALQLIDNDPRLGELAGQVFTAGQTLAEMPALKRIGAALLHRGLDTAKPWIVDDTRSADVPGLPAISGDLLVVPLANEQRLLGILYGGEKLDGTPIDAIDAKLCSALANSLSIFVENVMLYDDMQAMFLGTLHALTAAIDAKDSYTHGHSERVALMSRQLAIAAGLSEQQVERVYIAALVHDVGKIGVPESVLCKPGKLTDEEFQLIKMHPEIGARIIQDIRQMHDLVPGVLYHHERWDGRGYPHGKAGHEIPIFGRLICLADSFDAMSSSRTYRKGLSHDQVVAEIRRCAGTQFDPQLASLFVALDFRPYFETIERHQNRKVLRSA
jgi:HD-GYP domain-containing protein (c-di-GMP phosphodiesterase class II)